MRTLRLSLLGLTIAALSTSPVAASFHLMQIERVIGGFCGDVHQQAIQLRMRAAGQHEVTGARLVVHDAAGANSEVLITFPAPVPTGNQGSRILIATPDLISAQGIQADFELPRDIPPPYLNAGRLTFEGPDGLVYWSLAWGGAGYTGSHLGETDNDADGNFGPAFAGKLPFNFARTLQFTTGVTALSTSNSADYALSGTPDSLWNNSNIPQPLDPCVWGDGFELGNTSAWSGVVP